MKKSVRITALTFGITGVLCLLPAIALLSRSGGRTHPGDMKNTCIKKYTISRGESPWQGMTDSHEQEEANRHIQAVSIIGLVYTPLPHLSKYSIGSEIIMGRSSVKKQVVVNKKYFGNLERGDATRIRPGADHTIGTVVPSLVSAWGAGRVAGFLIESQIVETYWHLGAELCLVKEEKDHDSYIAHYSALHRYCTNECVTGKYQFAIKINTKTGDMMLSGSLNNE